MIWRDRAPSSAADGVSELARRIAKLCDDLVDVIFAARVVVAAVVERAVQVSLEISASGVNRNVAGWT